MEHWADKQATVTFLESNGFSHITGDFYDCKGEDHFGPIVQARIYQCKNGYWCVDLNGDHDWAAPVVWDGPKAVWDNTDTGEEFKKYLDKHYSGWR